jgi:uncharacterized membrane protein YgaE (UPF0421/DUF939 family)
MYDYSHRVGIKTGDVIMKRILIVGIAVFVSAFLFTLPAAGKPKKKNMFEKYHVFKKKIQAKIDKLDPDKDAKKIEKLEGKLDKNEDKLEKAVKKATASLEKALDKIENQLDKLDETKNAKKIAELNKKKDEIEKKIEEIEDMAYPEEKEEDEDKDKDKKNDKEKAAKKGRNALKNVL